jgi:hypothetical protein
MSSQSILVIYSYSKKKQIKSSGEDRANHAFYVVLLPKRRGPFILI